MRWGGRTPPASRCVQDADLSPAPLLNPLLPSALPLLLLQGPNPQPLSIPFPQAIQSLEPARLKPPARVTASAAGGDHSMAVTVAGALLAFGCNRHGQLGTGDRLDRMVPTEVPLALDSEAGQLVRAMQVQCGAQHTLALVQLRGQHQVRSAGGNNYGELGLGDRVERHRFHPVPGLQVSRGEGGAQGQGSCGGTGQTAALLLPCCPRSARR